MAFSDQYRALPGDYSQATATIPGISGCSGNGNGNERIDDGTASPAREEHILVWEHLSRAGFIASQYTCSSPESISTTPTSPFGVRLRLAWDNRYASVVAPASARHNLKTGPQIPSDILAEIDRKIDGGSATGGTFRFSDYDAGTGAPDLASCYLANGQWRADLPESNCGATSLL